MRNIEKYKDNIKCHIDVFGMNNEFYKIKHGEYARLAQAYNVMVKMIDDLK